jgi:hypothetical protein
MLIQLLLCVLLPFTLAEEAPGTPVQFDWTELLTTVNRERQIWNMPLLDYDDDVAKIAQRTCNLCAWKEASSSEDLAKSLCALKGLEYKGLKDSRYATMGETRAASAGLNANPSPARWLSRGDWDCANDKCVNGTECAVYRQAVWLRTQYLGCGKCVCTTGSPEPAESSTWSYLVCNYVEAGNWDGEHPFGANKDVACAGNYKPTPPQPQPSACSSRNCTNTASCPSPHSAAVCNPTTGLWVINSNLALKDLENGQNYIQCGVQINGNLAASGEKIKISRCGSIHVNGTTTFTASPIPDIDFEGVDGLTPRYYQPFFTTTQPIIGGSTWGTPIVQNVFSPTVLLCSKTATGVNTSYIYLFDCGIANPTIKDPLDDGSNLVQPVSSFSETIRPAEVGSGGDINDPDLQVLPKVPIDDLTPSGEPKPADENSSSNSSRGPRIPGWAIFLIVLAVLLIIAIIIVLIFLLFANSSKSERF